MSYQRGQIIEAADKKLKKIVKRLGQSVDDQKQSRAVLNDSGVARDKSNPRNTSISQNQTDRYGEFRERVKHYGKWYIKPEQYNRNFELSKSKVSTKQKVELLKERIQQVKR